MTTRKEYEIIAPIFPGFYNTIYELPDSWEDGEREHLENEYEVTDINYINWDMESYAQTVAKDFVNILEQHGKDIGVIDSLNFLKVISPQYYNYTNDTILVKLALTDSNIQAINNYLVANMACFSKYLIDNHTSCDGYISFIDNNADSMLMNWLGQENSISCVLEFILRHYLESINGDDWELELYYDVSEGIYADINSVDTDYGTFTLSEIQEGKHKEFMGVAHD